ncbi:MAG: ATP-binding protein [Planctomycetota bacterium]
MREATSLFEELQALDESSTIEAKRGSAVGPSMLETTCAFANEPGLGGGHLLLGVVRSSGDSTTALFEVVGVPDPDRLQSDLASACACSFNRPLRPRMRVESLQGKTVVVVFVPEAAATDKPVFLKNLGLPRGAFRRIGSTDQQGTEDDLLAMCHERGVASHDAGVVAESEMSDADPDALKAYRDLRALANPVADELAWSDAEMLHALGATTRDGTITRLTVAGLLLFGSPGALRRHFPLQRIDYIRIPGRQWVTDPDRRYDTLEIRAPLVLAARRAIHAVRDDLPAPFSLPEGQTLRRSDTILPMRVLREAIVNAVMHRSYRIHGPTQILRYANRLEIRNPGHSLKSTDLLGEPGSQTRNPRIAAVLHDLHLAETKGSGIRAMRGLMREHDLLPPTFESTRHPDQFVATFLFHHFLESEDLEWLRGITKERLSDEEARALVVVREGGSIDNATYRSMNGVDTLAASGHLRRLRDLGLLEMRGAGSRTYYVPGVALDRSPKPATLAGQTRNPPTQTPNPGLETPKLPRESRKPAPPGAATVAAAWPPESVRQRIAAVGRRPQVRVLEQLLIDLCRPGPRSSRELGQALGRDARELTKSHLGRLVAAGTLAHTIPNAPHHPEQKYVLPPTAPP